MGSYEIHQYSEKLVEMFKGTSWGNEYLEDKYAKWTRLPKNRFADFEYSGLYSDAEIDFAVRSGPSFEDELNIASRCIFYVDLLKESRKNICFLVDVNLKNGVLDCEEIQRQYSITCNEGLNRGINSFLARYSGEDEAGVITGVRPVLGEVKNIDEWEQLSLALYEKTTVFDFYIQFYIWSCRREDSSLDILVKSIDVFYNTYLAPYYPLIGAKDPYGYLDEKLTYKEKLHHSIVKYCSAMILGKGIKDAYPDIAGDYFDIYFDPYSDNDFIYGAYSEKYIKAMQDFWGISEDEAVVRIGVNSAINNVVKAYDVFLILEKTYRIYSDTYEEDVFTQMADAVEKAYRELIGRDKAKEMIALETFVEHNITQNAAQNIYKEKLNEKEEEYGRVIEERDNNISELESRVLELQTENSENMRINLEFIDGIVGENIEDILAAKSNLIERYQKYDEPELEEKLEKLCVIICEKINEKIALSELYADILATINSDFGGYADNNGNNVLRNPDNMDILKSLVSAECLYNTYIVNNNPNMTLQDYSGISLLYYCALEGAINRLIYKPYISEVIRSGIRNADDSRANDYFGNKPQKYMDGRGRWKNSCELGPLGHLIKNNPIRFSGFLNLKFGCQSLISIGQKILDNPTQFSEHRNKAAHGTEIVNIQDVMRDKQGVYIKESQNIRGVIKELFDCLYGHNI